MPSLIFLLLALLSLQLQAARITAPRPAHTPAPTRQQAAPELARLDIAYLTVSATPSSDRPFFDPLAADNGLEGAQIGIKDNNTTGRFTKQDFRLKSVVLTEQGDPVDAFRKLLAEGHRHILLDLPAPLIERLSGLPEARDVMLYDTSSPDDSLRAEHCRPNTLHMLPSRAMLADALAQYLVRKRWKNWFLAVGPGENDALYAQAIKRSARKFGARIIEEKAWTYNFDERRTPESEIPVFTQGSDDYDVLVVANETGELADLMPYRTWQPRPVAGSAGLVPAAWGPTHETWGALQLQNRFRQESGRLMGDKDYGAWLAVRIIGEAATRTRSTQFAQVRDYILGDRLSVAGFKGVPLSFRPWDHQLRQPVLLASGRSTVAVAPIEGYLHPRNELDTLGFDQPESACHF